MSSFQVHTFMSCSLFLLLVVVFCADRLIVPAASGTLGINYGVLGDNLPPPTDVVRLLKQQGITKIKLFDVNATMLSAFSGSGISVVVSLPNELLSLAAAGTSFTDGWVESNILPYNNFIEAIAVGNEVIANSHFNPSLPSAINNVHMSLTKHGAGAIKVSSPMAFDALQTSYPASAGAFRSELVEPVIKPILGFLRRTGSYLMINPYPFLAYSGDPNHIPLDYALGNINGAGNVDPNNGLLYTSLLHAQVDAVYAAMAAVGFPDVKLVVSETGWASRGDEVGATVPNAKAYNGNVARHVLSGGGTPLRPDEPLDVYIFALFNEDRKTGPDSERNYGLFYPDERQVYDIPLALQDLQSPSPASGVESQPPTSGVGNAPPPTTSGVRNAPPPPPPTSGVGPLPMLSAIFLFCHFIY